jgi:deferrochelatase/peroxidase EfeB
MGSVVPHGEGDGPNLLGFKDGMRNIKSQQTKLLDDYVWVGDEADQPWMKGGSYLVTRRIQMFLENWDRDELVRPAERHRPSQGDGRPAQRGDRVHHVQLHG